jgi:hypothetical protein
MVSSIQLINAGGRRKSILAGPLLGCHWWDTPTFSLSLPLTSIVARCLAALLEKVISVTVLAIRVIGPQPTLASA